MLIRIDNTTAVWYINDMGGRKASCNKITRDIWLWCKARGLWLTAAYLLGALNVEADAQSRLFHENTEWFLDQVVFEWSLDLI